MLLSAMTFLNCNLSYVFRYSISSFIAPCIGAKKISLKLRRQFCIWMTTVSLTSHVKMYVYGGDDNKQQHSFQDF